jgi:hypothetical protein
MKTKNLQIKRVERERVRTEVLPAESHSKVTWLLILLLFISFSLLHAGNPRQKDTSHWRNPTAEVKQVFTCDAKLKNPEILKLYVDNTYEFLVYQKSRNRSEMRRETGTYTIKGKNLQLKKDGKPKVYSPRYKTNYFISGDGKLYASLWDKFVNKDQSLLALNTDSNFLQPFYIDPLNGTIVTNKDAVTKIDLEDLVKNITRYSKNEEEKVNVILDFIMNSIEYDHPKANNFSPTRKGSSVEQMLAGKVRLGVCSDYSHITERLMKLAKIEAKYITGNVRKSINDIQLTNPNPHAWNVITVDGKKRLYDVCFADCTNGGLLSGWLNVKPSAMIRTHFPNSIEDQLLETPLTRQEFNHQPFINASTNLEVKNYFPLTAINYVGKTFTASYDKIIKDVKVYSLDTAIFEIVYDNEGYNGGKKFKTKVLDNVKVYFKDGKTFIDVPITNRLNALIFDFGEAEISYKVIQSSKTEDYQMSINSVNKNHIDSYFRAVFSALYLNDLIKLKELVGEKNPIFFTEKGKLKLSKELLEKFKTWDGLISCQYQSYNLESINGILKCTGISRGVELFGKEFQVELNEEGYQIIAMK